MIKLCLAGEYPSDENKIGGGVAYILYMLSRTFAEMEDVECHIVAIGRSIRSNEVVRRDGVSIHFLESRRVRAVPRLITDTYRVARLYQELKPDIISSHHIATTNAAIRARCRVIHTIHGIPHREVPFLGIKGRLASTLQGLLEHKAVSHADAVTSVSQSGLDAYRRWIKSPSYVVYPPVDDIFFGVEREYNSSDILFVGAIRRLKNVIGLLQALRLVKAHMPQVKLRICGPVIEPEYHQQLLDFIKQNNLGDNVEFMGVVDSGTICNLLCSSACLCLPSLQENAPVVICQAMAAATPVVASPVGGITELVSDNETGIVIDPGSDKSIADGLLSLLTDLNRAAEMGAAARAKAELLFDRHQVARQIVEIGRKLL